MKTKVKYLTMCVCVAVSSCASIQPAVSSFVGGYCANTAAQRKAIRESVNASILPNKIEIKCARVKDE